jgi:hypothetical protein
VDLGHLKVIDNRVVEEQSDIDARASTAVQRLVDETSSYGVVLLYTGQATTCDNGSIIDPGGPRAPKSYR